MRDDEELWEDYAEPLPALAKETGKGILYTAWHALITLVILPRKVYRNYMNGEV